MLITLALLFPIALLALMLVMERVERPLRRDSVSEQLVAALEAARPEELESFVTTGFAGALEGYWHRRRLGRLRAARSLRARRMPDRTGSG